MHELSKIYDLLASSGVKYTELTHADVHTMADLAPIEEALGAPFFRNLFLVNRNRSRLYLLLIMGDKAFRTSEVSKLVGSTRLSFGTAELLEEKLGVHPGAVNPLSLVFDDGHEITLVCDREILTLPRVCMHPGSNGRSLVMDTADLFEKVLPAMGIEPIFIDIIGEKGEA